jgi:hypothetical protein
MKKLTPYLIAIAIIAGCAKIVPPDGGPKDTDPPEVVRAVPVNETTGFKGDRIVLEFNEYVRLNDVYNQLVVSPPLKERPVIELRRKQVEVIFQEPLQPNVTYNFKFGEGIVDLTEGNPAADLQVVFSTGPVLDSLEIAGRVRDMYSGKPLDGVKVMLYRDFADSLPLTTKPDYFALSNAEGGFVLDYLRAGDYKVFALSEENRNYLYDDASELIAFIDSAFTVKPSNDSLELNLALNQELDTLQYLSSFSADSSGFIRAQLYNRPEETSTPFTFELAAKAADGNNFILEDSLFAWNVEPKPGEELIWVFTAGQDKDTIDVVVEDFSRNLLLKPRGIPPLAARAEDTLVWVFERPLTNIDTSRFSFFKDSIALPVNVALGANPFGLYLRTQVEDDGLYRLQALPGALTSREGWTNDTLEWKFTTHSVEHYGQLLIDVTPPLNEGSEMLVELELPEKDIQRKPLGSDALTFERLLPGSYVLRLIHDVNGDGKWTPSDYTTGRLPETVWVYPEQIKVRSNWNLDIDWTISRED